MMHNPRATPVGLLIASLWLYWATPRGETVFLLPFSLRMHAKAVVTNTCIPSHVSWLNKDYIYLIRIIQ